MARCVLDHILVLPDPIKKTPGIILSEDTKKQMQEETLEGTVVEVGPGRWEAGKLVPVGVKKGDRILYDFHSGIFVVVYEKLHRVMREPDVLVVLGPSKKVVAG